MIDAGHTYNAAQVYFGVLPFKEGVDFPHFRGHPV
jgi:hypothetical protein